MLMARLFGLDKLLRFWEEDAEDAGGEGEPRADPEDRLPGVGLAADAKVGARREHVADRITLLQDSGHEAARIHGAVLQRHGDGTAVYAAHEEAEERTDGEELAKGLCVYRGDLEEAENHHLRGVSAFWQITGKMSKKQINRFWCENREDWIFTFTTNGHFLPQRSAHSPKKAAPTLIRVSIQSPVKFRDIGRQTTTQEKRQRNSRGNIRLGLVIIRRKLDSLDGKGVEIESIGDPREQAHEKECPVVETQLREEREGVLYRRRRLPLITSLAILVDNLSALLPDE